MFQVIFLYVVQHVVHTHAQGLSDCNKCDVHFLLETAVV